MTSEPIGARLQISSPQIDPVLYGRACYGPARADTHKQGATACGVERRNTFMQRSILHNIIGIDRLGGEALRGLATVETESFAARKLAGWLAGWSEICPFRC